MDPGILASVLKPLSTAASAALFIVAAAGKIADYSVVRDWVALHVPAGAVTPAAISMIALDVCVALTLLATSIVPVSHLLAAAILLAFLAARATPGLARACPCFGRGSQSSRAVDRIMVVLIAAHAVVYLALPRVATPADVAVATAMAAIACVGICWVLLRGSHSSSRFSGVLVPEQLGALLTDMSPLGAVLPKEHS